jgi:hypothetical protein
VTWVEKQATLQGFLTKIEKTITTRIFMANKNIFMDRSVLWQSILEQLQQELPRASFDTWVRDTQVLSFKNHVLVICARNSYTCDWLTTRLQEQVTRLANDMDASITNVQFVVDEIDQQDNELSGETDTAESPDSENASTNFTAEVVDATQYENEVRPDRIVALDGYALRLMEHGDLEPKHLSLWLGFKQAIYRHMKNNKGTVRNIPYRDVIQFAMMSRATYFRETTNKQDGIAGGLVEEVGVDPSFRANDRRVDNARRFRVHMSPRLTRRDCATLEHLIEQEVCQAITLVEAREFALKALLRLAEETPAKLLDVEVVKRNKPADNWPRSVAEIVRRVLDLRGDMPQDLHEAAEKLQNKILFGFGKLFITHHFIKVVVPGLNLTHSQVWAIIALRAKRWYDKDLGAYLDWSVLSGGLDELGELVGVDRKTVKRWMSHPGFQLFVTPEQLSSDKLPEGWDPRTTFFTIRSDEPLHDEIAATMEKFPISGPITADKVSNGLDKMSNDPGQSEQGYQTKRVTLLDKMSNGHGQNEQRLNKILLSPINSYKLLESPPVGTGQPQSSNALRAVVGNGGYWDFDALMINNSVLNPKSILAANKKYGRDLKTSCEGFVSLILYACSEHGGKLRIDPTATAVSGLCRNIHAGAGGDYDRLAKLPPSVLQSIFKNALQGIPPNDDDDAALLFQWHFQNLPSEDKIHLYRRLFTPVEKNIAVR